MLTSDIVTSEERHKWSQALSVTWSASAIAGPLLGGIFSKCCLMNGFFVLSLEFVGQNSEVLNWRWACELFYTRYYIVADLLFLFLIVYMNIPVGITALLLLSWSLRFFKLERTLSDFTWSAMKKELVQEFDFAGVYVLAYW